MRSLFERVVIFSLLLVSTGAGIGLYVGRQTSGGGLFIQLGFGCLYACILVLLIPWYKNAVWLLLKEKWMLVFLAWATLSTFWSVEPGDTMRRSIALLGTVLAGLYIGLRYEPRQQIKMVAACVAIGAFASLAVCLFLPRIGHTLDDAWQGVYYPKNSLARMMTLGVLCFSWLTVKERRHRVASVFMVIFCLVLMVMAKSATGIVVCLAFLAMLPFHGIFNWPTRRIVAVAVVVALVATPLAAWSLRNSDLVLDLLARKSTLTGRIPLWQMVKHEITSRPAFGFGFGAFWSSSEADRDRAVVNWDAPNAHNGFLEITLGLGLVGLAIFLAGLVRNFWLGVNATRTHREIDRTWPVTFLLFGAFYNLTETTLIIPNSIFSILYVANAYWLVRICHQAVNVPELDPSLSELSSEDSMNLSPANG